MDAKVSEPVVRRQKIRDLVRQAEVIHRTGEKSRSMGNPRSEPRRETRGS